MLFLKLQGGKSFDMGHSDQLGEKKNYRGQTLELGPKGAVRSQYMEAFKTSLDMSLSNLM